MRVIAYMDWSSRFLKDIENRFPTQSYFALASGASGAGMVNPLFDKQPKYLLIDEIEHMKRSDTRSMKLNSIFAACNDTKRSSDAVLSRFQVIHLKEYTKEEFVKVTVEQLSVDDSFATFIAENVWVRYKKHDIRDCVRVANMCQTEDDVLRYLELLQE